LEEKKGEDIILIDIHDISDFTDYFVITTGTSDRMLAALADAVRDEMRSRYDLRGRLEGEPQDGWLLNDFGEIIVHIFSPDRRAYYRLEELWSTGKVLLRLQ
jgi:ribosome-associated protein